MRDAGGPPSGWRFVFEVRAAAGRLGAVLFTAALRAEPRSALALAATRTRAAFFAFAIDECSLSWMSRSGYRTVPPLSLPDSIEHPAYFHHQIIGQARLGHKGVAAGLLRALRSAGQRMPGQRHDRDVL